MILFVVSELEVGFLNDNDPVRFLVLKNPGYAAVFSFFWPGLGQIYNGQIIKGTILIFLMLLSWLSFLVGLLALIGHGPFFFCIFLMFFPLLTWLFSMTDAYRTAEDINNEYKLFCADPSY